MREAMKRTAVTFGSYHVEVRYCVAESAGRGDPNSGARSSRGYMAYAWVVLEWALSLLVVFPQL